MSSLLTVSPVIPVVAVEDADQAVPLARALSDGGIGAVEIVLRTPAALSAITRIAEAVPSMVVGAGTITKLGQVSHALDAGARFLVSPGSTPVLIDAMSGSGLPFLPGAATASEVLALLEYGITEMKFFPAEAAGGPKFLAAIAGPLPAARFCPTGGITAQTAPGYLALPNVGCVGGTWIASRAALAAGDWAAIRRLASQAAALSAGD